MPSPVVDLARVTPTAWSHGPAFSYLFLSRLRGKGSQERRPQPGWGHQSYRGQPEGGMRGHVGLLSLSLLPSPL